MAAKQRFPWVPVSAVVAVGVVAAVAWLQLPENEGGASASGTLPSLGLTRLDSALAKELLAEKLAAYDPAPLFIPSPMNSNEPPLPDSARSGAGGPFVPVPPELTKTGPVKFLLPVPLPQDPVAGLRLTERADDPLALRRSDTVGEPLKARLGQVQAVTLDSGQVVLTLELPLSTGSPQADWQPLELMGAVTRAGLSGGLVVTSSSGSAEIDEYFRSHLAENVRIGERLSPGFYAFRVGP